MTLQLSFARFLTCGESLSISSSDEIGNDDDEIGVKLVLPCPIGLIKMEKVTKLNKYVTNDVASD